MTFLIKFLKPENQRYLFSSKYGDVPMTGRDEAHALERFEKYLGKPYGYKVLDISVIIYDDWY